MSKCQILFLDIDGVLLVSDDLPHTQAFSNTCRTNLLALLHQLPDLQIVITSSYRLGRGYERLLRIWREDSLPDRIIGGTPVLGSGRKGQEIMAWLEENQLTEDACRFAILDDHAEDIVPYVPVGTVFPCRSATGLTAEITAKMVAYFSVPSVQSTARLVKRGQMEDNPTNRSGRGHRPTNSPAIFTPPPAAAQFSPPAPAAPPPTGAVDDGIPF
ncbi:MAG: HAD domain-containing protein [Kiritimatiellaeota bacterium]|nr:HAD domain-containing protein [Kiritimatiellota bacterium]